MIFNMTRPGARKLDRVPVLGEDFTYTGNCTVIDDSSEDAGVQWHIKFLSSGDFTVLTADWLVDAFLVGGGNAGLSGTIAGGKGGDGGRVLSALSRILQRKIAYNIIIGEGGTTSNTAGQATSAFGQSSSNGICRSGGRGGAKDTLGRSGSNGYTEFLEDGADLYAGSGGGGGGFSSSSAVRTGGRGGTSGGGTGGAGGTSTGSSPTGSYIGGKSGSDGTANTGGGGGGGGGGKTSDAGGSGGDGGSGIAIIRKHKEAS